MLATLPDPLPRTTLIIGAGRLGMALGIALQRAGWPVTLVARRDASATRAADRGLHVVRSLETLGEAACVLLCVPDDAVASTARAVDASPHALSPDAVVLHTSGAVPVAALSVLAARTRGTGSLHPLQTIAREFADDVLSGAPAAVTGSPDAIVAAEQVALAVGLVPFRLADDAKPLYHAACSMAANFTVGLLDAAIRAAAVSGMDATAARQALAALARNAVDQVSRHGAEASLTGPILRGDAGTVRAHLDALHREIPALVPLYIHAARQTLALARRAGLDRDAAEAVDIVLSQPTDA